MTQTNPVFTPFTLGSLTLRNRVIRSAAFEGMSPGGRPSDALIDYHRQLAAGGVGMTTVAYASVSDDGRTYDHQISLQRPGIVGELRRLTAAVQDEGAAIAIQIGHAGYFSAPQVTRCKPLGPSRVFNQYTLRWPKVITDADIDRLTASFSEAASRCREAGFDAIEMQAGHGYLLSQFLSPHTNRRNDHFGGSVEARLRFPLLVLQRMREAVGDDYPILVKMNLQDGFPGGQSTEDAVIIAQAFAEASADALVLSGGFVSKAPLYMMRGNVPVREMVKVQDGWFRRVGLALFGRIFVKTYPFEELFFLEESRQVREAVKLPLVLIGGILSRQGLERALAEGFEFVAMGRALIHDPEFLHKLEAGVLERSECDQCNLCIVEMDAGGVRCPCADEAETGRP